MKILTMKTLKQSALIIGMMVAALILAQSVGVSPAFAQVLDQTRDQPGFVGGLTPGVTSFRDLVLRIVDYFLGFLGLLAVIMVIYAGFLYVSSAGNEESVGKAKKILMYAAIGIVVIVISYLLVNMILGAGTGQAQ